MQPRESFSQQQELRRRHRPMIRDMLLSAWSAYFNPAAWEADGHTYERLGVRRMSWFLMGGRYMNALLGVVRGRPIRMIGSRRAAHEWLVFTVITELGHGFFLLVMLGTAVWQASEGRWRRAAITLLLDLIINAYPMMVQRYNRARILRAFGLDALKVLDLELWRSLYGVEPEAGSATRASVEAE